MLWRGRVAHEHTKTNRSPLLRWRYYLSLAVNFVQNGIATSAQQSFAYRLSESHGILVLARFPQNQCPIRTRDHRFELQSPVDYFGQRPDRYLAASTHLVQQGPFTGGRSACDVIIEKFDMTARV